MSNLFERLKIERERLNLSQSAFGDFCGVKKLAQINYENGTRAPDANYLEKAANIGVDVTFVLTGLRSENTATTPVEMAFLRQCRAFKNFESRMKALEVLTALSGYKPESEQQQ